MSRPRQRQHVRTTFTGPGREAKALPAFWCRSIGLPHVGQSGVGSAASIFSSSDAQMALLPPCDASRMAISMPSRSATSLPVSSLSSFGTSPARRDRMASSNAVGRHRDRTSPPSSRYSVDTPPDPQMIPWLPVPLPANSFRDATTTSGPGPGFMSLPRMPRYSCSRFPVTRRRPVGPVIVDRAGRWSERAWKRQIFNPLRCSTCTEPRTDSHRPRKLACTPCKRDFRPWHPDHS